jgi:hypothetical protein
MRLRFFHLVAVDCTVNCTVRQAVEKQTVTMFQFTQIFHHCAVAFCVTFALFLMGMLLGCGGGTTGTGDYDSATIAGKVLDVTGVAVAGASVTIGDSEETAVTDAEGNFEILAVEVPPEALTNDIVVVQGDDFAALGELPTVLSADTRVEITIVLSADKHSVAVEVISIDVVETQAATLNDNGSALPAFKKKKKKSFQSCKRESARSQCYPKGTMNDGEISVDPSFPTPMEESPQDNTTINGISTPKPKPPSFSGVQ